MNLSNLKSDYKTYSLEKRLLIWVCIVGSLFCLLNLVFVALSQFSLPNYWYFIVGFVSYLAVAYAATKTNIEKLITPLVFITQLLLTYGWYNSEGIKGSTDIVFILTILIYVTIFDRKWHGLLISISVLNLTTLIVVGWIFPNWTQPFPNELTLKFDHIFTLSSILVCLILVMKKTKSAYDEERTKAQNQNETLRSNQGQLLKAKEIAEESMRVKGDFLSVISHEMRTPLNAIIGSADYLQIENENPAIEESIKTLQFSAHSLHSLINDVLDFSKIDSGKLELNYESTNLKELVASIIGSLKLSANEKLIGLTMNIDPMIDPWVKTDADRLTQILINLIGNAIKFTDSGGVEITIQLVEKQPNHQKVRFLIKDTGIGLKYEDQKHIFERFTQVRSSNTRNTGGTGLGLSICRGILECFGSKINLDSQVGIGSCFWFDLILDATPYREHKNDLVKKMNAEGLKGKSILLIEDNKINIAVASRFLIKWGVELDVAEDGLIGFNKSCLQKYDLILMDIQMPIMDGYESTTKIREEISSLNNETKIVALTASDQMKDLKSATSKGLDGLIKKPFKAKEFYHALFMYLNN